MLDLFDLFVDVEKVGQRAFACETWLQDFVQFASNEVHRETDGLLGDILSVMHGALGNFSLTTMLDGDRIQPRNFLLALFQLRLQRLDLLPRQLE